MNKRLALVGVALVLVYLTLACGGSSSSRPRATSTPNPARMSIADCTEYVVDNVLWDDAPAYILVCINEGLGDKEKCTREVRLTLNQVARDWCIENR